MTRTDGGAVCVVCRAGARRHEKAELAVLSCDQCGHRSVISESPASYDSEYDGFREDARFLSSAGQFFDTFVSDRVPKGSRVLDVGAGNGAFLELARDRGLSALGVDVASASRELCRERGFDVLVGDLRALPDSEFGEPYLVSFWDVVEHLHDPVSYLARARGLLAPGGLVLAKVPLVGDRSMGLVRRVPRLAGPLLHVPSHVQFFTETSLTVALQAAGFGEVQLHRVDAMRTPLESGTTVQRAKRRVTRALASWSGDTSIIGLATTSS